MVFHKSIFSLLWIVLSFIKVFVLCQRITNQNIGEDNCSNECTKIVALSSNSINSGESCARGCRFFDIAQLIFDGNSTRETCCSYCDESYKHSMVDLLACRTGCNVALPRIQVEVPLIAEVSWSLFIDSVVPIGYASESEETSLDAAFKDQVIKTEDIQMKSSFLPMKREFGMSGGMSWSSTSSTSCRGGLPHCLLGSLLLLLVVVALLLGLLLEDSNEKRKSSSDEPPPLYTPPSPCLNKFPIA